MKIIHRLLRACLGLIAILSGCSNPPIVGAYGMPPANYDPEVRITSFEYSPTENLHVGDTVTFTIALNKPASPSEMEIGVLFTGNDSLPPTEYYVVNVADDGVPPDQLAGDGVFTGSEALVRTCDAKPVMATCWEQYLTGDPMTVLPEEEP